MKQPRTPKMIRAAGEPSMIRLCAGGEKIELAAADAQGDGQKLRKFSAVVYNGGQIRVDGFWNPIVIDLEGLKVPRQDNPVLKLHDTAQIVGHTESVTVTPKKVTAKGVISGVGDAANEVLATAGNGFPWQTSIGASADSKEFVDPGTKVKVNGQTFTGPIVVIRQSTYQEMSFVPVGADQNTSATLAATRKVNPMDFDAWLAANGFEGTLSAGQKSKLQLAYKAEQNPAPAVTNPAPAPIAAVTPPSVPDSTFEQQMQAIEAETQRQEGIRKAAVAAMTASTSNRQKCEQIKAMCDAAVLDKHVTAQTFELTLLRFDRGSTGHVVHLGNAERELTDEVIEAAIAETHKLPNLDKHYSEQTLNAAHKQFRRGIGLKEMLQVAAQRNNNYRGSIRDERALCAAAFKTRNDIQADAGPSTISVPGILSNIANKFLAAGFLYTEQSWRGISKIGSANDFKTMTTYRLGGANKFEKIAPGGEIKHGTLSELSYTNKVETYGKMLGIDRRDIINDDLGAFTGATMELARGAGDSLNEVFWTTWLADSAFFTTGHANLDNGTDNSVLNLVGLENADNIFAAQTKSDGTPLGATPTILLVPRTLRATAKNLMNGTVTGLAQTTATLTLNNSFQGMFQIVDSIYLASTAITGYSTTAWYLLTDPQNIACIQVAFLNGMESPTVEQSEFEFDRLGIAMRAWMDWGCSLMEYRGGVKLTGAS